MKPNSQKNRREAKAEKCFHKAAERLGFSDSLDLSEMLEEPCPEWQLKLALRMARSFSPELRADDLKTRPQLFNGYYAASLFLFGKFSEQIDFSAFSKKELHQAVSAMFEGQGLLEVLSPTELLAQAQQGQQAAISELPRVKALVNAALKLPLLGAMDFFIAFGDGLRRQTGWNAIRSLRTSNTVQICLFVISSRPLIEAGVFRNISELIDAYYFLREKQGEKVNGNALASKEAFSQQFRRICSAAGLKISRRGRPRNKDL